MQEKRINFCTISMTEAAAYLETLAARRLLAHLLAGHA